GDVVLLLSGECFSDPDVHVTPGQIAENNATWLVRRYEEKGDAFFEGLNGVFSGFLIDRRRQKAALFNDRYGVERVYYHESRDGFFFASEAKALLRILPQLRAFHEDGLVEFLRYGCTLGWKSLFRDIGILPGASLWTFTPDHRCNKSQYFVPAVWQSQPTVAAESFAVDLGRTFIKILPRYFESDRTMGVS